LAPATTLSQWTTTRARRHPREGRAAGLVEYYVDEDGQQAMRLSPDGERVARQLAMLGEDGQDVLMAALLEYAEG
jgi:hypothetical protein